MKKNRILVIGQTPPPHHGQALMLQAMLQNQYEHAELFHVRLDFSRDVNHIGSFKLYKIWGLLKVIFLTWIKKFYYRADILYYAPAGPNKIAMYRDVFLLLFTRIIFKKFILHTHAGGSSRLYPALNPFLKSLYRVAFFKPDALITLTNYSHGDDVILQPKKVAVVPNGIKDEFPPYEGGCVNPEPDCTTFLYVGAMYEQRGTGWLIEAAHVLKQKGYNFKLNFVGVFIFTEYNAQLIDYINKNGLENNICFLGPREGDAKWREYCNADIFCFPTYVPSETFGIVLVEAMQFKKPVIASRWNGVPNVVDEGKNALLVEPKSVNDMVAKMELLINDKSLRDKLGSNGRERYLERYSTDTFFKNMDKVFAEI